MIIPKAEKLSSEQLQEIESITKDFSVSIQPIVGTHRTIYAMKGDERHEVMINRIEGLNYIERVDQVLSPYKLMDKHSELSRHHIRIGAHRFGSKPIVIAGHCAIDPDNPNLFLETAQAIKEAGADAIRGGIWKPRTNPYSFQGDARALKYLVKAREETGLPVCTEVMDNENLRMCLEAGIDCLQIGTRNALNYSLLKEIGRMVAGKDTVILLKRSRHMAPMDEFILAGEYLAAAGNPNVVLCPRGTLPAIDGYRNYPDESIIPLLKQKTWAPVLADPSHAVGKAAYVPQAALAAMCYGADGVVVESHISPQKGVGDDPKQAITPEVLTNLIKDMNSLYAVKEKYLDYLD